MTFHLFETKILLLFKIKGNEAIYYLRVFTITILGIFQIFNSLFFLMMLNIAISGDTEHPSTSLNSYYWHYSIRVLDYWVRLWIRWWDPTGTKQQCLALARQQWCCSQRSLPRPHLATHTTHLLRRGFQSASRSEKISTELLTKTNCKQVNFFCLPFL